jgi:DMSO/TMAO reductase YedYZ molybdopterin-dependent catalytic subunit
MSPREAIANRRSRVVPARARQGASLPPEIAQRLPPGQILTRRWPVLHQGDVPPFDPETWDLRVWGLVDEPRVWTWDDFSALPMDSAAGDLHCVTRWSSIDHRWRGVRPSVLFALIRAQPMARFALLHGEGGYTANVPVEVLLGEDVLLATHHDGEPLLPEHGAPLRVVIPSRYAWKSVKWLRGIELLAEDEPGFWERYGYSNSADPWREQRFES